MSLTVCIVLFRATIGGAQALPGRNAVRSLNVGDLRASSKPLQALPRQREATKAKRQWKRFPPKENARRGRSRVFEGTIGGEEGRRGSRQGGRGKTPRPPATLFLLAGRGLLPAPGIHHR